MTNKIMNKIKKLSQKYENILNKLEIDHLTNFSASTSNFYSFPNINKFALKSEVLEPSELKTIVAGPLCPTRPLSDLLDEILKPFNLLVKTYVRDNIDLLDRCSRANNENTF